MLPQFSGRRGLDWPVRTWVASGVLARCPCLDGGATKHAGLPGDRRAKHRWVWRYQRKMKLNVLCGRAGWQTTGRGYANTGGGQMTTGGCTMTGAG